MLSLALLFPVSAGAEPAASTATGAQGETTQLLGTSYGDYAEEHAGKPRATDSLLLTPEQAECGENTLFGTVSGRPAVTLEEGGEVTYRFQAAGEGLYQLTLDWYALEGSGMDVEIALLLDGEFPFEDARCVALNRVWQDKDGARTGEGRFQTDNRGNEISPKQVETFVWQSGGLKNKNGYYDEPFWFWLTAGEHTLTIRSVREPVALGNARFHAGNTQLSYAQRLAEWVQEGAADAGSTLKIEAEMAATRSDPVIFPTYDRSTPSTSPNDPAHIRQNVIGGANWKFSTQWVEWVLDVPESGLYTFQFKYRQDLLRGLPSHRRIIVDGEVPYQEFGCVEFPYGQDWQILTPSVQGEPLKVYLTQGKHTLRLEALLGDIAPTLQTLEQVVYDCNRLYRRIVMITGTTPDAYRDYYLDSEIPELVPTYTEVIRQLREQEAILKEKTGSSGNQAALFAEVIRQLESFLEEPDTIPQRLDYYRSNIGALAELLLTLCEQPLQLDTIAIVPPGTAATGANAGFFSKLWFRAQVFTASFFEDYSSIGNFYEGGSTLDIWLSVGDLLTTGVSSGRDQAQVLKRLIDDEFVPMSGVAVNLSLVDTASTLTQAILGGRGPDAALFVPKGTQVNLGMRGAIADLTAMPQFEEICQRFHESAFIGYTWDGGVYALPETQTYNMLFVRTDIFAEMGLTVPDTWEEFHDVTARLQKKNLLVGIPENQQVFEALLLQNGGSVYNGDLSRTTLTTTSAVEAFREWTGLYVQYGLPQEFNFFNRFRTGEMAMGIMPFTTYNQLAVAAPEIRNLWAMAPIPGTLGEDGIDRTESCSGTGCILISDSPYREDVYRFFDWWTSADIQKRFGNELEVVVGTSSRYNTANVEAFSQLAWTGEELSALQQQRDQVWDIPQTPATYYITRSLTNAFRRAVYYHENPREVMEKYGADMDKELIRKRQEFGLEGMA